MKNKSRRHDWEGISCTSKRNRFRERREGTNRSERKNGFIDISIHVEHDGICLIDDRFAKRHGSRVSCPFIDRLNAIKGAADVISNPGF